MAGTTWRELGPRKSAYIVLIVACECFVEIAGFYLAFHMPRSEAIPLAWAALAFAALIFLVLLRISSLSLNIVGVLLAFASASLFMFTMARWGLWGHLFIGEFAFMLIVAISGARKQTAMRRRQDDRDMEADG